MTNISKKLTAALLCTVMALSATACGEKPDYNDAPVNITYDLITLGKDYTDIRANLTVLTHRTDLIQDTDADHELPDYVKQFNTLYPNIQITFEGVTDYDFDMANRLPSGNWGDICMIPGNINNEDLPKYFEPFGLVQTLSEKYETVTSKAYDDTVYGIPSEYNIQGVVYNKKVWSDAGITKNPTTPAEFIHDLKQIKEKTDAIPLYTNYEAKWPLTTWDYNAYLTTGDADYRNAVMITEHNPFSKRDTNTGPYEVYKLLYDIVNSHLSEENPNATSWELCKEKINNGEIGCMVLGSWAVSQMQSAGPNADDIGYMPFPFSINDTQYALLGSDYCYAINKNSSDTNKKAAELYIKFMVEKSGYAYDNSCLPVLKNEQYPTIFTGFKGTKLLPDVPTSEEFDQINTLSGIDIGNTSDHIAEIIDAAKNDTPFENIIDEWNTAWNNAASRNDHASIA